MDGAERLPSVGHGDESRHQSWREMCPDGKTKTEEGSTNLFPLIVQIKSVASDPLHDRIPPTIIN